MQKTAVTDGKLQHAHTLAQSNVQVAPKFLFGHKGDVNGNLFFLDNSTICYPCGHNIVIYSLDDGTQKFIPGTEGSEGITAMALSHNRKQLAVCEQASKAICTVYNIGKMLETFKEPKNKSSNMTIDHATVKKRRILASTEYTAKAFISCDFSLQNEKLLVTIGDDCRIVVWQWDKQKCLANEVIQLTSSASVIRQVSFSNTNGSVILVTGKDVYKFFMLSDNSNLKQLHSSFARKDDQQPLSTNFICHTWLADGKFIVCTDIGQILLFEQSGDFK